VPKRLISGKSVLKFDNASPRLIFSLSLLYAGLVAPVRQGV